MKKFDDAPKPDFCCSCKIHIWTGALIVTLLSLAFGVCLAYRPTGFHDCFAGLTYLLTSVLGIYAYSQRVAWAWLPITVWNGIWSASHLLTAVACHFLRIASYFDFQGVQGVMGLQLGQMSPQAFQIVTAGFSILLLLMASLWAWCTMITYRAFKWQKREDSQNAIDYVKVAV